VEPEATREAALETTNLSKSYPTGFFRRRPKVALEGLTLRVGRGEIFGYLGPNGSGKTTTLKILMGIVAPDSGEARVLGRPLRDPGWKALVGYLPEHPYFYDYLTPLEYLDYVGRLFNLTPEKRRDRAKRLLELVGLSRAAKVPMRRFSKGMVQRLGIAQALVSDPQIVFMDEPMSGLDPIGRRSVQDLILALKLEGKTVFFSTHILSDAERLCDRVAVLRSGRLLDTGPLDQILRVKVTHVEIVATGLPDGALAGGAVKAEEKVGERTLLEVSEDAVDSVLEALRKKGGRIVSVHPVRRSLEDYFFEELGQEEAGGQWTLDD
jgi:ABC-2 type transport system ATP-binding protein